MTLVPVILCGGSGTRMWPLSRSAYPKQYLALHGQQTLVQQTAARLDGLANVAAPIIITNNEQRFLVAEQMLAAGIQPQAMLLEPMGRNTAPAVAVAAWQALHQPRPLLLLVPRHPQRFAQVRALLQDQAAMLPWRARSDGPPCDAGTAVLLGDAMGELRAWLGLATLLAQIDHYHASQPATVRQGSASGISLFEVSPRVQQATTALLATLADPLAARLFGDSCTQALLYALLDQETIALQCRQWVAQDGQYARFIKATAYIQSNLATALAVPAIARHAGLSESSLNRAFKRYAADTPLQYIKKVRLNQAHTQLQSSSCTIQHAAHAVGYESVSQFSRDYKRYFGSSPRQHRHTPPAAAPAQ